MKKVLVAEDEQAIREFVVINLKRAGYEPYEASNGEEALEIYEREGKDFDVAILDIMMPGKYDGLAVCKELRKQSGSIGIIMLTARTQEMDKVSGLMMGADDYVTKPFSRRNWWRVWMRSTAGLLWRRCAMKTILKRRSGPGILRSTCATAP